MAKSPRFVFRIKKDRQVDGDLMNRDLIPRLASEGGAAAAIATCFQCGTCSGGCTAIASMDLSPRILILLLQRGEWQRIIESESIWNCTSCQICTARCPRGVRPSEVLEAVRALAIRAGVSNDATRFHQVFLEVVKRRGILSESDLLQRYGGLRAVLDQAVLGMQLALRGKVSPFHESIRDPRRFADALQQVSNP